MRGGHCQGLKLSEKCSSTRRRLIEKKRDSDNETQTTESWRRETYVSTLQIQKFNQRNVICTTRKEEEEEKETKSVAKPFDKSEEEECCGNIRFDSMLSRYEIFTTDYNSPILLNASSILGKPNDTHERLSDIRNQDEVSCVKWPLTIRVCNGCRVSKTIRERVLAATCLQTDPNRYRIETSCLRADPPTAKSVRNAEEKSYGTADKVPTVFLPKSFKNIPKKGSPTMRVKNNRTSSILRGRKLIAVKGSFTRRKKVANCHKKKRTYEKRKDTDNEVGISRYNDDVRCEGNGKENERVEKFFCESSGSQNLAKYSIKCRNIMQTKSKHSLFSEMEMKTESTKSKKVERENFSKGSKKILEKIKPKTILNSFPNEKISSLVPRGRQLKRDKEISSVMTIWHWLRRRHRVRNDAVSASSKQRTPSLYNYGSSSQDVKDPFLSLFFPLIAGSGFLMSTGKATSGAKGYRNL